MTSTWPSGTRSRSRSFMPTPKQTANDLNMAISGFDTTLEALARLYTNDSLAPDDTTLVRESYAAVNKMRNQMADIKQRTH